MHVRTEHNPYTNDITISYHSMQKSHWTTKIHRKRMKGLLISVTKATGAYSTFSAMLIATYVSSKIDIRK